MRVVFVVARENHYRVLGPIVDAALQRGWTVECWHDLAQPTKGPKAAEFLDSAPSFRYGVPRVVTFHGMADLAARLTVSPPDAVVSLRPPPSGLGDGIRWIGVQFRTNLILSFGVEKLLACEWLAGYSRFWHEQAPTCLEAAGMLAGGRAEVSRELAARFVSVGVPELDQLRLIDPARVRARLGLAADRPVVLYLPYPVRSNPQTFWLRHVYRPRSRLRRALAVLLTLQLRYWGEVARGWNDARVVDAVRAFCDANDALLVVKSRLKDPVPCYTRKCADLVMYDESYFPATILELLSIASLCVHFFSSAVYEAVGVGVPSLCIAPSLEDMGVKPLLVKTLKYLEAGRMYNFPGVSYYLSIREAIEELPRRSLKDFSLDSEEHARFVKKFLGFDDCRSSERILELIEKRREGRLFERGLYPPVSPPVRGGRAGGRV